MIILERSFVVLHYKGKQNLGFVYLYREVVILFVRFLHETGHTSLPDIGGTAISETITSFRAQNEDGALAFGSLYRRRIEISHLDYGRANSARKRQRRSVLGRSSPGPRS